MTEDALAYVQSKGIRVKQAGGHEVHFACPFHGEPESDRGRLYLNVDLGVWTCFVCGEKGSLYHLKRFFGDNQPRAENDRTDEQLRVLSEAASYYQAQLSEHLDVVRWLRGPDRMLDVDTVVQAGIGYAPPKPSDGLYRHLRELDCKTSDILATGLVGEDRTTGRLVDSLLGMVTIPYYVAGHCVTIRGRKWPLESGDHQKYKTLPGQAARLYHGEACWGTDEIAIAEGELDALVLTQLGVPAVGVPGANVWQDGWATYLEGKRRVWILFDPDEAGDKGAAKLIDKLGPRARRIRLPSDVTDWVAQGHSASELHDLMAEAGRSRYLVTVHEAWQEWSALQGIEGLKFDFESLDYFIEPGLMPGQLMIPLASTGVGKTLFLLNVLHRVANRPGQEHLKLLFVSLEQTRAEWIERARRIYRFYNLDATNAQAREFWSSRLLMVDRNRLTANELEATLDDFEYEFGEPPGLVCLDYLGYFAKAFRGDPYERITDAVSTLKGIAKDRRLPFIVPHQVSRGVTYGEEPDLTSGRDGGTVEETADFILSLWRPDIQRSKREEEKDGSVLLRVKKSRHGNVNKIQEFIFGPYSLVLVPKGDRRYPDAVEMAKAEMRGDIDGSIRNFDHALSRHRNRTAVQQLGGVS